MRKILIVLILSLISLSSCGRIAESTGLRSIVSDIKSTESDDMKSVQESTEYNDISSDIESTEYSSASQDDTSISTNSIDNVFDSLNNNAYITGIVENLYEKSESDGNWKLNEEIFNSLPDLEKEKVINTIIEELQNCEISEDDLLSISVYIEELSNTFSDILSSDTITNIKESLINLIPESGLTEERINAILNAENISDAFENAKNIINEDSLNKLLESAKGVIDEDSLNKALESAKDIINEDSLNKALESAKGIIGDEEYSEALNEAMDYLDKLFGEAIK